MWNIIAQNILDIKYSRITVHVHVWTTIIIRACINSWLYRCGDTKIKMKFATYRSVGFNYRSRRPTFKPQRTEEAITSDEGAISQPPQAVELTLEQKPFVRFHLIANTCSYSRSSSQIPSILNTLGTAYNCITSVLTCVLISGAIYTHLYYNR